jgi:hypothetical protein
VRFISCSFYDNYVEWGSAGAGELPVPVAQHRLMCRKFCPGDTQECRVILNQQNCLLAACPIFSPTLCLPLCFSNDAVSTSAETWFINTEFERNIAGQYGGAILLEGGCPAAYFLNYWFKVKYYPIVGSMYCPAHCCCADVATSQSQCTLDQRQRCFTLRVRLL